jgi:hypothetical protein
MTRTKQIRTFFLLALFFYSCQIPYKKGDWLTLDYNFTDSVVIKKVRCDKDTIDYPSKRLTNLEISKFYIHWNSCKKKELCKFLPTYEITVYSHYVTQRHFRANGGNIKEDNDYCYQLGDENYFDNLYKAQ